MSAKTRAVTKASKPVVLAVDLTPDQAAALYRLCDKISHSEAIGFLYAHLPAEQQNAQASEMLEACELVRRMLDDQGVRAFPWLDVGGRS